MKHAKGTFNVKITPEKVDNIAAQTATVGRNSIEKQLEGAIVGVSHAEMLWSGDPSTSGAYVAIEKVIGSLDGREGTFMLMHSAVMNRGTPEDWQIRVIPDSGTASSQVLAANSRSRSVAGSTPTTLHTSCLDSSDRAGIHLDDSQWWNRRSHDRLGFFIVLSLAQSVEALGRLDLSCSEKNKVLYGPARCLLAPTSRDSN